MASVETRINKGKKTYRIRLSEGEHPYRPRIGLGAVTKKEAGSACGFVENLVSYCNTGKELKPDTQKWLNTIRPFVRRRLEALGLIEPEAKPQEAKNQTTLSDWIDGYIKGRTDAKPGTITAMNQAVDNLYEFISKDTLLVDFTPHDADKFRRHLLAAGLAESTTRRRCKYAKQFFAQAIKARIISSNPFDDVPVAGRSNTDRQQFISREDILKVIEACPNSQWKLIFTLSRYGGLRIPSELFGLRWEDILWDKKRFIIHSPKTEHHEGKETRICPLFPELEACLLEVFEQSEAGQTHVITIYNENNSNLRTQAIRIIKRSGVKVWPKLFNNLRSSRETELVETFPIHVVTEWLGNSPDIANKHYLQTHEEHFKTAIEIGGLNRGQTAAVTGQMSRRESQEENQGDDTTLLNAMIYESKKKGANLYDPHLIVPRGFEPLLPG